MENHNEISEFIWNIKEHIRDEYAEKDYEEVILPFTLLRRIDCVLEGTHEAVVKANEKFKDTASSSIAVKKIEEVKPKIKMPVKNLEPASIKNSIDKRKIAVLTGDQPSKKTQKIHNKELNIITLFQIISEKLRFLRI